MLAEHLRRIQKRQLKPCASTLKVFARHRSIKGKRLTGNVFLSYCLVDRLQAL